MSVDLREDPKLLAVASQLSRDVDLVVGKLHRFWSWAHRYAPAAGDVELPLEWLDRYVEAPGFGAALTRVGWLEQTLFGFRIPCSASRYFGRVTRHADRHASRHAQRDGHVENESRLERSRRFSRERSRRYRARLRARHAASMWSVTHGVTPSERHASRHADRHASRNVTPMTNGAAPRNEYRNGWKLRSIDELGTVRLVVEEMAQPLLSIRKADEIRDLPPIPIWIHPDGRASVAPTSDQVTRAPAAPDPDRRKAEGGRGGFWEEPPRRAGEASPPLASTVLDSPGQHATDVHANVTASGQWVTPNLEFVTIGELRDEARVLELHDAAAEAGWFDASEATKARALSHARDVLRRGNNPGGLFLWRLKFKTWPPLPKLKLAPSAGLTSVDPETTDAPISLREFIARTGWVSKAVGSNPEAKIAQEG